MQTIRTTITFPEDLHQNLMITAIKKEQSLSQVVVNKLTNQEKQKADTQAQRQIDETLKFFDQIARSGKRIDMIEALQKERDRRHE